MHNISVCVQSILSKLSYEILFTICSYMCHSSVNVSLLIFSLLHCSVYSLIGPILQLTFRFCIKYIWWRSQTHNAYSNESYMSEVRAYFNTLVSFHIKFNDLIVCFLQKVWMWCDHCTYSYVDSSSVEIRNWKKCTNMQSKLHSNGETTWMVYIIRTIRHLSKQTNTISQNS